MIQKLRKDFGLKHASRSAPGSRAALLALLAGMTAFCAPAMAWQAPPAGKIEVKTADDLPRHTYKIEGAASDFLVSDAAFRAFVSELKANTLTDLEKYDIQDKTTLKGYQQLLAQIAMFEGNYDEAIKRIDMAKELEGKESVRLMSGQTLRSMIAARKVSDNGADKAAYLAAFKKELESRVAPLPWDKVRESILQARSTAMILNKDLIIGQVKANLDPVVAANNGEISGDYVAGMVNMRNLIDNMLELQPAVAEVYGKLAETNSKPRVDVLSASKVELAPTDSATPVVIGIWDSGVDVSLFSGRLWENSAEIIDGKDNDNNGFVDDVNGIAYDMNAKPTSGLLISIDELKSPLSLVETYTKGAGDSQAGVQSKEADAFRTYVKGLKSDQVQSFMEDLGLYGNYSHGTHVTGIATEGNPFARVYGVRLTFDFKAVPRYTWTKEFATDIAKSFTDTVALMKKAGVRVVNMSWGLSREDIEKELEAKGIGKSKEERAELSREYFKIIRDAMKNAMASAPEILFVPAAGNSDNDNTFAELIPSGIELPNVLTIGAIDSSGKPTSFTTFGKGVTIYANGFEVESYVPGGKRFKYSGTSMAAPNVTNLVGKMVAVNPELTTAQIVQLIRENADPMQGYDGRFVINPKKTVAAAKR
ncbi:MAG: S8 family serine peptidase [Phycisphaeraceae bacterium]|nr:S8 family serine peptidase [Phycisphaeraceae bacterium]